MNNIPCALLVYRKTMLSAKRCHSCPRFFVARPVAHFRTIFRPWTLSPNIPALRSLFMSVTVKQTL